MTGCKGGGGSAVSLAAPGDTNGLPTPGDGDGTTSPGTGTGTAAELAWDAPALNTDGSALTDLTGYKVYYGPSSGNYTGVLDVGMVRSYSLSDLAPGTYIYGNRVQSVRQRKRTLERGEQDA